MTESVVLFLVVSAAVLAFGVWSARAAGLYVTSAALVIGNAAQLLWLARRAAPGLRALERAAAAG